MLDNDSSCRMTMVAHNNQIMLHLKKKHPYDTNSALISCQFYENKTGIQIANTFLIALSTLTL
ncbi:hypothetical protein RA280_30420 [Cupriavidus sp. CV2]|uniref:hypothetical protein n=1 Tax=Cupriavidus ulmosensis TaxID=3065913 RepID=UPI00296B23D6|nr:hypothetical protein [Cupriavidus sp. CV2]MDW3685981.1 hypothetical protein [Cupriavidus sp. CV2]